MSYEKVFSLLATGARTMLQERMNTPACSAQDYRNDRINNFYFTPRQRWRIIINRRWMSQWINEGNKMQERIEEHKNTALLSFVWKMTGVIFVAACLLSFFGLFADIQAITGTAWRIFGVSLALAFVVLMAESDHAASIRRHNAQIDAEEKEREELAAEVAKRINEEQAR